MNFKSSSWLRNDCDPDVSAHVASRTSRGFFVASLLRMMVAFCFAAALTGCKTIPPAKPLEQLTPQEHAGYVAFQQNCATCHYDRDTGVLHGPSLLGVFRNQYLPSGAPANDDRVTNVILRGRGMMPPMRGQLGSEDVADILAYLKTL